MIISTKKYACETCIKGHRSSSCRHTDRPLFEIKKKGRPVTQCEHCRELRKTKQVHVKCVCESKATHGQQESTLQGSKIGFERAAFPNGLPQALEASVAFQTSAEGSSSDSDHGGITHGPRCKAGMPCNCAVPKSRSRKKANPHMHDPHHDQPGPSGSLSPDAMSNTSIMKRIAELRPVLPRPPHEASTSGPVHIPSIGHAHPHPHTHRNHKSGQAPYELAYGVTHQHPLHQQPYTSSRPVSNPTFSYNDQSYTEQMQLMGSRTNTSNTQWNEQLSSTTPLDDFNFPSMCGCGDDCDCPGCLHHNRSTSMPTTSAYASCTNPGACSTCLDCTIMSLPASALVPTDDTSLSIPNAFQQGSDAPVAEWLRQISAGDLRSNSSFSNLSNDLQQWGDPSFMNTGFGFGLADPPQPQEPFIPSPSSQPNQTPHLITNRTNQGPPPGDAIDPSMGQFISPFPSGSTRSRSTSSSSQSSHHGSEGQDNQATHPYTPAGRQQGLFSSHQALAQLHISRNRPVAGRASSSRSSASLSPSPNPTSRPPFGA